MNLFILISLFIIFVIGAVYAMNFLKKREGKPLFGKTDEELPKKLPYRLTQRFFTRSETAFFLELKKNLPDDYNLFSKVRMWDFVETTGRNYRWENKIKSKHVDFLICDFNFKPLLAIELNGKSHLTQKMQKRDELVKKIYDSVNLPVKFINVGESFDDSIKKLISEL